MFANSRILPRLTKAQIADLQEMARLLALRTESGPGRMAGKIRIGARRVYVIGEHGEWRRMRHLTPGLMCEIDAEHRATEQEMAALVDQARFVDALEHTGAA